MGIQNDLIKQQFRGCGAIVLNEEDKILFGLRKDSLKWGLPGGKVEDDEIPMLAVHREIEEETGLFAKCLQFIFNIENYFEKDGVIRKGKDYVYLCRSFMGDLKPQESEVVCLVWLTKEQSKKLMKSGKMYEHSINSLQKAFELEII